MADSTTHSSNVVTNWERQYFAEYTRANRFSRFEGTGANNVIVTREGEEQIVSIPFIARLSGAGVSGSTSLVGSEEALGNYGWDLTPTYERNAVVVTKEEAEKPNFDYLAASREQLNNWARALHRDNVVQAMGAIYDGTTYSDYGSATEGAKDTWLTNNGGSNGRVLFGAGTSNEVAGDHSMSLANIDGTNDTLSADIISLSKRLAQMADPHLTPLSTREDDEFFVFFCNSLARRDLLADTAFQQAQREANLRGEQNNPLFKGGDLMWDNVLIREVPEMDLLIDSGAGAAGIDVGIGTLCGQESVGWALGQRPRMTRLKEDDYDFRRGVGVEHKEDVKKMYWNNVQNVFTTWTASVAD